MFSNRLTAGLYPRRDAFARGRSPLMRLKNIARAS
jgi:hypothetical protein